MRNRKTPVFLFVNLSKEIIFSLFEDTPSASKWL